MKSPKKAKKNQASTDVSMEKKQDEKEIAKLRSMTVYNNYMKGMKLANQKRAKEGLGALRVRTFEEWLGG